MIKTLKILFIVSVISTCRGAYNGYLDDDTLTARQQKLATIRAYEGEYDPMTSRIEPSFSESTPYTVTKERLDEIREYLMYPYYDVDEKGERGDLEKNINTQNTQVNKQLTFLLPFFGFGLNYTWVSLNGYLGFSDAPFNWRNYPLYFPAADWPVKPDPSFIGPFYSKCNIGQRRPGDDHNQREPGVYWRLERDLPTRSDQVGVEIRERLMWDIRQGIVGAAIFVPKHAIIVTWKNVTFAGGSVNTDAKHVTNTFQLVVATDEIRSYAMFNYEYMSWTSHTEAGGSSDDGQGGVPAFVGFNAGNGTRSYEYVPYSQSLYIRDLAVAGYINNKPGRHLFRVDEVILSGSCRREENLKEYPLVFSPEHGNMMGGNMVNMTGPCFETSFRITCQFDTFAVEGQVLDHNTAVCICPRLMMSGYTTVALSINGGPYYWKGRYFVETPLTSPEGVWFTDTSVTDKEPEIIQIQWLAGNLTQSKDATVTISLWGYREKSIVPELVYIDVLATGVLNVGREREPYTITPADFASRENWDVLDLEMGFIVINLTIPEPLFKLRETTTVWSRPIPLSWYFHFQWEKAYGIQWTQAMCDRWIENDRNLRDFTYEVERCPCLLSQALADKGRFLPDFACDQDGNSECFYHFGASHCVNVALPNKDGAGQQCCYDRDGYLYMTSDKMWGGHPHRAHNLGKTPFDEANKVPTLSHWYHDLTPFYPCCYWQSEQSPGCVIFRFERRVSQDCVGYQPPSGAAVFGDPHFYTFDYVEYTFNGLGEFVLVRADSMREVLDIQGRFERVPENYMGAAKGSMLTSVAARDNISSVVEIRRRPMDAIWRYHLDVIVDGNRIYFDRFSQKIQQFQGCVVYTPSNILNQSHVIVMFSSGAGVEVMENMGHLGLRVYLPIEFTNITKGLFGNWTFDPEDDFLLPDGTDGPATDTNNLEVIHNEFGMKWVLDDKEDPYKGKSMFFHENTRSSNYYYHPNFVPEFNMYPELPGNATTYNSEITRVCGDSYQCNFDYTVTLRRDFAIMTKYYQDQFVNIREDGLIFVVSCGQLPTPPNGRKSTFNFLAGAEVKFDCDPGFVLLGEQRRWCYSNGDWSWPRDGDATCITEGEYLTMQNGIVVGTILAMLIPILLALCCFVAYCRTRVKMQKKIFDPNYTYRPGDSNGLAPMDDYGNPQRFTTTEPISDKLTVITEKPLSSDDNMDMPDSSPDFRTQNTDFRTQNTDFRTQNSDDFSSGDNMDFPDPPSDLIHSRDSSRRGSRRSSRISESSSGSSTTVDSVSDLRKVSRADVSDVPPPRPPRYDSSASSQAYSTKDYYTREPVNSKPVVFQNTLWGVEERITPSPPSSNNKSSSSFSHNQSSNSHESAV